MSKITFTTSSKTLARANRGPVVKRALAIATLLILAASGSALASDYNLTVTSASTFNSTVAANATFTGNVLGVFGYVPPPTGGAVIPPGTPATRTLTGFFGGTATTNQVIPLSGNAVSNGNAAGTPVGTYSVSINTSTGAVTLRNLTSNMLGAAQPTIPVTLNLLYSTFRTRTPDYTYFSFGVPIPLPLGNATLTQFDLVQTAPVSGTATLSAGTWSYTLPVPVQVNYSVLIQGSENPATQTDTVTVSGTITPSVNGQTATSTLTFSQNSSQPVTPTPATPPPTPVYFQLPAPSTATPPPPPAHTLLTLLITGGTVTINGSSSLPGSGPRVIVARLADVASDSLDATRNPNGSIGPEDLDAFIAGFISNNAAIADVASDSLDTTFNPNGAVGPEDLDAFIANFIAG